MRTDSRGRPYARLSQLKPGDKLEFDDGFTCIPDGATRKVRVGTADALYVTCRLGRHYLDGQLVSDGDACIGVYHAKESSP